VGGYSNNEKISKVITLSSNYKRHREVVASTKPAIDCSDAKHMRKALKLSAEKDTYTKNVRQLRLRELKQENNEIMKRLVGVKSAVRKEIQPIQTAREAKTLQRSTSRQSVTSAASDTSCASNFRRRTLRQQEIERENKQIAARILRPKRGKETDYLGLCNFYEKEQGYSRIRSRFSERSQTIMTSLALDGLKLKKQHVQFLPQLSFKRLDRSRTKGQNKTVMEKSQSPRKETVQ
jgi:hypothetical protein